MTSKTKIENKSSKEILAYYPRPPQSNSIKCYSTKNISKVSIMCADSQKANRTRTQLLLLLNSECNKLIKEHKSMINTRTFAESEKEFSNDHIFVHLKPEIHSAPVSGNGVGELHMSKNNFSISSPSVFNGRNFLSNFIPSSLRKKETLGHKKLDHFKATVLKGLCTVEQTSLSHRASIESLMIEEKLELINVEQGYTNNKRTLYRVEQGFAYLQKKCSELKKVSCGISSERSETEKTVLNCTYDTSFAMNTPKQESMKLKTISSSDDLQFRCTYGRRRSSLNISKTIMSQSQSEKLRRGEDRRVNLQQLGSHEGENSNCDCPQSHEEEFSIVKLRQCRKNSSKSE